MLVQRVVMPDDAESWTVLDDSYDVVEPVEQFLAHQAVIERSPQTVRSYAFDLRDFFWFLHRHKRNWSAVTLEDFGHFVGWLGLPPDARNGFVVTLPSVGPHCSESTINRKLSAVAMFYEFHMRHGVDCGALLTVLRPGGARGRWRPFLAHLGSGRQRYKAIKLRAPRQLPKTLTSDQIKTILGCCERLRDKFLITLLAQTGMRIGEALGLRHDDVDPAHSLIRVRSRLNDNGARVKNGEREIPVSATLIRLYTDYLVDEYGDLDCDFVFVNLWSGLVGRPWRYWNVTDLVARVRERSGVRFTVHMLRHSYATELLRRKVPAEVVQKLLGHASITTTTQTYAHLEIEDIRRALQAVGWLPSPEV
ncbi:MAG TPA: tyrosine-type recombinase/integrase [Pseudonocardiaceae bacterium]|nr:tyrosine-type recombinase/integrase [Pseudonocardiaceae bacterium]